MGVKLLKLCSFIISLYLRIIQVSSAQDQIVFSCEEDWTLFGTRCYKVFSVAMSWNDAERTCHNYGAHLVSIFGFTEHQMVTNLAVDEETPIDKFWIGLTRRGHDSPDGTGSSDLPAFWSNNPGHQQLPASLGEGYWSVNQPDLEDGNCVHVQQDGSYYYSGGWSMANCLTPLPFVCESRAGLQGFFRCANGRYIQNTDDFICDGEDDCDDFSDEIDCSSSCMNFIKTGDQLSGTISSGSPYSRDSNCLWTLEAPAGSRVSIEFTRFFTEKDADWVQIWAGGKTERFSDLIGQLSGNLDTDNIPVFHSTNNFLSVRFHSDSSTEMSGFQFDWTIEPQYNAGIPTRLQASTVGQTFQSPDFGSLVKTNVRERWIITVPIARRVISLQVLAFDLPECAGIEVYDGEDFTAPLLDKLTSDHYSHNVVSTGNELSVYYQTCDEIEGDATDYHGFQIMYRTGCGGEISANQGHVFSPGYKANITYPNYQECEWLVKSPTGEKIKAIFRGEFELEAGVDILMIYDAEDASGISSYNLTGSTLPEPIISEEGNLFVRFSTNSIINKRGFYLDFSTDCPELEFNDMNMVEPTDYNGELDSEVLVSCPPGYVFAQEEHKEEESVHLVCMLGEWNVHQTPQCEPIWCGQAPAIDNGYYSSSTGSQFGDSVTYACYAGYEISGNETITCSNNGEWTISPVCTASQCEPLDAIENGRSEVDGDGSQTDYGSIVEFTCDPGYELFGVPRLYCNGTWSSEAPTCKELPCPIEVMALDFANGRLMPSANVSFGDMVSVECHQGFVLKDTNRQSAVDIECLANQTFNATPSCVDDNECAYDNGDCDDMCTNTIGGYECSCGVGFTPDENDTSACNDIDECAAGGVGFMFCQDSERCENTLGSYVCKCPDGTELFTDTSEQGLFRSFPLEGEKFSTELYINHSCILIQCPMPGVPDHAHMLTTGEEFDYRTTVYFACDLGYVPTSVMETQCQANGEWSVNTEDMTCEIATCELPNVSSLTYAPEDFDGDTGNVTYGVTVTANCKVHRPNTLTVTRQCLYDITSNSYQLYLNGASAECPIIDCGVPSLPQNSRIIRMYSSTKYDSTFEIACEEEYTKNGNTTLADNHVICGEDGKWDFGDFECYGVACSDPGTKPGTTQIPYSTYEPDSVVGYKCNREGFALSSADNLTCIIDGGETKWNGDSPECSDTTNPVITQEDNLCQQTVEVDYLTPPGFALPTVTDNTGSTEDSGLLFNLDSVNNAEGLLIPVRDDITFVYSAEDFAGNTATCTIEVTVKDRVWPTVQCPESYTVYTNGTSQELVLPQAGPTPQFSDDTVMQTYKPETLSISADDVGKSFIVEVTATDAAANSASCSYMVHVEASECSDIVLDDPHNGVTTCMETQTGFQCTMTCNAGYYFYEQSGNGSLVDSLTYTCTFDNSFNIDKMPDCVSVTRADFYLTYDLEYDNGDNSSTCLGVYSDDIARELPEVTAFIQDVCGRALEITSLEVDASTDVLITITADSRISGRVGFRISPSNLNDSQYETCAEIVNPYFTSLLLDVKQALKDIVSSSPTCPNLVAAPGYFTPVDTNPNDGSVLGDFVCTSMQRKRVDVSNAHTCLPCPPGHYYDSDLQTCTVCAVGEYQDGEEATACIPCDEGTDTYSTGSRRKKECRNTCTAYPGFVSRDSNNLPPCVQCGSNQYSDYTLDANTCQNCPEYTITNGVGASSDSECMSNCSAGTYSDTGYEPCTACPRHFYNEQEASDVCQECPGDKITLATGADEAVLCIDGAAELCTDGVCSNGGNCSVENHHIMCACQEGYTGPRCETMIDYCSSNPCYAGECIPETGGYSCNCPSGEYSGDNCEVDPDNCDSGPCEHEGMCFDQEDSYICLCPLGYSGERCEVTADVCEQKPCGVHGECVAASNRRRICNCNDGWTGEDCDVNINECESNPCLYGFNCTDGDNSYTCECNDDNDPDQLFSGVNCQDRVSQCSIDRCGDTGECYDDYRTNSYLCICNQGYEPTSPGDLLSPWYYDVNDISVNSQCKQIDYCEESDPCINSTCENSLQGAVCHCPSGYTGHRCQRNVDNCEGNPCENGECMDEVNGYTCDCYPGFTGKDCDTNIDNCDPYPCTVTGTFQAGASNGCQDLVDDFQCSCKPGYNGKMCENDIDECLSSPCLHGGKCQDQVNDYICDCPSGWEGKRCETISSACGDHLCEQQTQCLTVFGTYICACSYPYFGKLCEKEASTCRDANPCVNDASSCKEDDTGVAACTCTEDFSGDGCEMAVDYCEEEGFCQHGGDCESSLDGFTCICLSDFTGSRCQDSVDDCAGITCQNDGTCVDGVGQYFCQCPIGSEGPDCNRDTDTDWDLYFYSSERSGMAYTAYPFEFGEGDELSIALWVKFAEEGGEGNFFSLYRVSDQYLQSPKKPFLQLYESGVTITFSNGTIVTETFGLYDINDGNWYFITVTWSEETELLQVMINTVRVIQLQLDAKIESDFGFMLLGAPLEDPFDSSLESERGESFQGYISHVYLWDVALDYSEEIPQLSENILMDNLVRSDNLLVDWSATYYQVQDGVYILSSSTAGDDTCDAGFTGENCDELLPDKESPTFDDCPDDVVLTVGVDERFTDLMWPEPEFEDITGKPMAVINSSRILTPGWYPNAYVAYDSANNAAVCTFDIFVRFEDCEPPASPTGVTDNCDTENRPFRTCTPSCEQNDRQFSIKMPNFYTCGPEGSFNVFEPRLPLEYPECAAITTRTVDILIEVQYPDIQSCSSIQDIDALGIPVREHIGALDDIWKVPGSDIPVGAFCMGEQCEDVVTVTTVCVDSSDASKRKKRATQDTYLTILISGMVDPIFNVDTSETRTVEEVLLSDILDDGGLTFSDSIPNADPSEPTLVVLVEPSCPMGSSLSGSDCVECARGTYYNSSSKTCVQCPVGEYQDMTGRSQCTECPNNQTTQNMGTKSQDDCFNVCDVGKYANTDTEVCDLCERGYYQPDKGQFFCYECEADTTTAATGSQNEEECYAYCGSGTELTEDGTCKTCGIGNYRKAPEMDNCEPCTNGKVTPTVNAESEDECTVPNCQAGSKIVGDSCELCPVGEYQPDPYQEDCMTCDDDRTTLSTGSTSEDDCLFFCPMGGEELTSEQCTPCEVGFFKNNSLPLENCEECPPNMLTEDVGSISMDNCTVLACQPGTKANDDKSMCVPCERGTYQAEPNQEECEICEDGKSTRDEGADQESLCEEYCPDGEQAGDDASCEPCPRGYYRNVNEIGEFSPCAICPDEEFITEDIGGTSVSNCSIRNCSSGSFLNDQNECEECARGYYQPEQWQTECIECEGQRTTDDVGAVSKEQCKLDCEVGYEDPGSGECEECQRGYYKDVTGPTTCKRCEDGSITSGTGATSEDDCNIANCQPGTYRTTSENECVPCPRGTYEDRKWQEDSCQSCDQGETTLYEGAVSKDECVANCEDGTDYDEDSESCLPCVQGYYRTQGEHDLCQKCPEVAITAGPGATSEEDCNLGNCTAGFYQDGHNCLPCAKGQYQPEKWMDSCIECEEGQTTLRAGSQQQEDCFDIPPPITLTFTIRLDVPFLTAYRNRDSAEYIDFVARIITAVNGILESLTSFLGNLKVESLSEGSVIVLLSARFEDTITAGVGGNLTSEAELLAAIQIAIDSGTLGDNLFTDPSYQARALENLSACQPGQQVNLNTGNCENCTIGYYQPHPGFALCLQCPTGFITADEGTVLEDNCYHPDNCVVVPSLCPNAGDGERCNTTTQRCVCRPGWSGSHPNCTHKCDLEEYCENGGRCQGKGTDDVTCDCSETNYEGEVCQTRKDVTSYTNAIIGGAIGGGLGLFLLIMLVAACCCGFRRGKKTPVEREKLASSFTMPLYGQSAMGYTMPPQSGVIVNPGSLYGGATSVALPMVTTLDRQSIPGYIAASGGTSTFMYHDDMTEGQ